MRSRLKLHHGQSHDLGEHTATVCLLQPLAINSTVGFWQYLRCIYNYVVDRQQSSCFLYVCHIEISVWTTGLPFPCRFTISL